MNYNFSNIKLTNFRFKIKKTLYFCKFFNIKLRNLTLEESTYMIQQIFFQIKKIINNIDVQKIKQLFLLYRHNQTLYSIKKNINFTDLNLHY